MGGGLEDQGPRIQSPEPMVGDSVSRVPRHLNDREQEFQALGVACISVWRVLCSVSTPPSMHHFQACECLGGSLLMLMVLGCPLEAIVKP